MPKIQWTDESKLLNTQITTKETMIQLNDKDDHNGLKKSSYILSTEDMSKTSGWSDVER